MACWNGEYVASHHSVREVFRSEVEKPDLIECRKTFFNLQVWTLAVTVCEFSGVN